MCGITGILNLSPQQPPNEDLLLRMISIIRHRGPDEQGLYLDDHIGLGHARLSIIGIDSGTQPICNEDQRFWIVYNGEIFNYIELRKDLEHKGHRFGTDTDTEVIVHLYEDLGPGCLSLLNGQFALALWDSREKELFLARDRVGIRPLYYTFQNGRFLFASEIKALFLDPSIPRQIDLKSLAQVFTCWTTIGSRTIFQNIHEMRPGHFMLVKQDKKPALEKSFWSLPWYPPEEQWSGSIDQAAQELAHLLEDSVRLRLRADVPVGAYMSGGLDSSIITSIIAGKFNNRLKIFSLSFEEKAFDESAHQMEMARFLGTDHHQVHVSNQQIRELFPRVIWHCEKPLLRTSPVPMLVLSGLVREHSFKVVLTGEGADEIFGGYNIFKEAKIRDFWSRLPDSKIRPLLLERLYPYIFENPSRSRAFLQKFFALTENDRLDPLNSHRKRWENTRRCLFFLDNDVQTELMDYNASDELDHILPVDFRGRDVLSRAQWLEMEIFMSNYLLSSQGDRVGMANSVEIRLPFLDYRVIDFAARLPARWKLRGLREKYLLKKAFQGRIPESILKRPKQPYRAPISQAFFNGTDPENLMNAERLGKSGLFNTNKVMNLFNKYQGQSQAIASEVQNMAVVGILSTQLIYEQFVEGFNPEIVNPVTPRKIINRQSVS